VDEELPDAVHELAISWLIAVFGSWLARRGFVFGSELKVVLGPRSGRKPDLVPDIAIEVITPSPRDERRDRIAKMGEYAAFGIEYYWLVDPALGSVEIFELNRDRKYTNVVGVTSGVIERVPGCDGLGLDVDE
jgi:Uma2 family endonuclease